jgi:tetratricopeptide (TPR) repeat protein
MLLIKFAKRLAMILVVTAAPLMMPRAANAGADEFEAWQRDLQYQHSLAAQLTRRGDRYLEDGDLEKALPLYTQALATDKKFVPALTNRAECYMGLSKLDAAVADLNRAIAIGGSLQGHALGVLGNIERGQHHYAAALPIYDKLLKDVTTDGLLQNRAECYAALNKPELAITDYTASLKYATKKDAALYHRALLYNQLHQYNKVIADCSQIINQDPDGSRNVDGNVRVLKLRAQTYSKLGKEVLAKQDLERADRSLKEAVDDAPFNAK